MVILASQPPSGEKDKLDPQDTTTLQVPSPDGNCHINMTNTGFTFSDDDFQAPSNPTVSHPVQPVQQHHQPPSAQQLSPLPSSLSPFQHQHQVQVQSSVHYARSQPISQHDYYAAQPHHPSYSIPPRQQLVQNEYNSANSVNVNSVPDPNFMTPQLQYSSYGHQGPYFPPQNFDIPDIEVSNSVYSVDAWSSSGMSAPLQCHLPTTTVKQLQNSNVHQVSPTSPESIEDNSSGDDSISQLAHKRSAIQALGHQPMPHGSPVAKKPKPAKKRKKRDPNEPQKPVSAYALFFRDTQAAIKSRNPSASFGEVSKLVASMWDQLDEDHKNVYKKRTELAKKEYLKQLAAYRASLVCQGSIDNHDADKTRMPAPRPQPMTSMASPLNQMGSSPLSHPMQHNGMMSPLSQSMPPPPSQHPMSAMPSNMGNMPHSQHMAMPMGSEHYLSNQAMVSSPNPSPHMGSPPLDSKLLPQNRCSNPPVLENSWENDFCANDITSQSQDIYTSWAPGQSTPSSIK